MKMRLKCGEFGINTKPGFRDSTELKMSATYFEDTQSKCSVPTVSGSTFIDQNQSTIVYGQLESLSLVGARIKMKAGNSNPAIYSVSGFWDGASHGGGVMSIADTSVEFEQYNPNNLAIRSYSSVHLHNVYTRNSDNIVEAVERRCEISGCGNDSSSTFQRPHVNNRWHHIAEYAARILPWTHHETGIEYDMPIYINGSRQTADYVDWANDTPVFAPPADLQSRHQWEADFPSWEDSNVINVKLPPYNAAGDGDTDDTDALQRAINDAAAADPIQTVYLPKGYYRVSRTLNLQPNTQLIGTARHLSHILAEGFNCQSNGNPSPVVNTPRNSNGSARIAFIDINQPWEEQCAHPLYWQTGGDNITRSINITARSRIDYGIICILCNFRTAEAQRTQSLYSVFSASLRYRQNISKLK